MTTTATPCTDEQKADWSRMHERLREIHEQKERAESLAFGYLGDHVAAGAMMPGEFGLPNPEALADYRRACKYAADALKLSADWHDLYERALAHPYTAEVNARREAQV